MYKSDFLNEINSRGFIHQSSDIETLDTIMKKKSIERPKQVSKCIAMITPKNAPAKCKAKYSA